MRFGRQALFAIVYCVTCLPIYTQLDPRAILPSRLPNVQPHTSSSPFALVNVDESRRADRKTSQVTSEIESAHLHLFERARSSHGSEPSGQLPQMLATNQRDLETGLRFESGSLLRGLVLDDVGRRMSG